MTTTSPGKLKAVLQIGKFAFVDEGTLTVLYDLDTQKPVLCLTAIGEYALARMLVEKTQYIDCQTREEGETLYREQVSVEGRVQSLS